MDREREAWKNIKDNATSDYHYAEVYDATPTPKPNYISATLWTTLVAVLVCSIFTGFLLYLYNESNIEETLSRTISQAIHSLEQTIEFQSKEISALKEENKRIHSYLELWTPIDIQRLVRNQKNKNKPPTEEDLWDLGPAIIRNHNLKQSLPPLRELYNGGKQCLPLLE